MLRLAETAGLSRLAEDRLSVPGDMGANPDAKVSALVAGMVAGADSIEDMALLRHGGMGRVFDRCYAPSTLGSWLRTFTFGHMRQLDGAASRFLTGLVAATPLSSVVSRRWRRSTSTTPSTRSTARPSRVPDSATQECAA